MQLDPQSNFSHFNILRIILLFLLLEKSCSHITYSAQKISQISKVNNKEKNIIKMGNGVTRNMETQ